MDNFTVEHDRKIEHHHYGPTGIGPIAPRAERLEARLKEESEITAREQAEQAVVAGRHEIDSEKERVKALREDRCDLANFNAINGKWETSSEAFAMRIEKERQDSLYGAAKQAQVPVEQNGAVAPAGYQAQRDALVDSLINRRARVWDTQKQWRDQAHALNDEADRLTKAIHIITLMPNGELLMELLDLRVL